MKYRHVFLLGRPGSGKSAVYREIEKSSLRSGRAITCERVDDFPKLWARLQEDDAREEEGKERIYSTRTGDGGWLPHDDLLDLILQEVNADVLAIKRANHMILIEFSRSNYVKALQNFDPRILDRCFVIYIQVGFELCWARNVARHQAAMAQSGDDHMVYREAMERLYLHDDQETLVQHLGYHNIPVSVVNNEADGEEHLQRQVKVLYQGLLPDIG